MSETTKDTPIPFDYDALMRRHLTGVFGERNPELRMRVDALS